MKDLELVPIKLSDIDWLDKTEYKNLSTERRMELVISSTVGRVDGEFFRFFLIKKKNEIIGVVNMRGHGNKVVSVAPELIEKYRGKGFWKESLKLAYSLAKQLGFKEVTAGIRKENHISQRLHEKLGFNFIKNEINKNGNLLKIYSKQLF